MSLVACALCGVRVPADLLESHQSLDEIDLRERRRLGEEAPEPPVPAPPLRGRRARAAARTRRAPR